MKKGRSLAVSAIVLLASGLLALLLAPTQLEASYDWLEHGVSESAGQGVDGAWVARLGFILMGLGTLLVVHIRRRGWQPAAMALHLGFGVSMFAVAAFSIRSWDETTPYVESEDLLHSIFATTMGFCFILGVLVVLLTSHQGLTGHRMFDLVAIVVPSVISLMMSFSFWGVIQRSMFLIAAIWYSAEALLGVSARRERIHDSSSRGPTHTEARL